MNYYTVFKNRPQTVSFGLFALCSAATSAGVITANLPTRSNMQSTLHRAPPTFTHNETLGNDASGMNSRMCSDCHWFDPIFSHPVDIYPPASMDIPSELPLERGKMTCITCHANADDQHPNDPGRLLGFRFTSSMGTTGLCFQCHDASDISSDDIHARATNMAHLPGSDRARLGRDTMIEPSPDWIDSESDACLTCHDGAMASGSGRLSSSHSPPGIYNTFRSEHPIGEYTLSSPHDADGALKPASMLDHRVRLFNNHVGCGSCHSVYSPEINLLVMPNEGSQLCLECHEY